MGLHNHEKKGKWGSYKKKEKLCKWNTWKKCNQLGIKSHPHNYGWRLWKLPTKGQYLSRITYLGGGG
jgi:hypothetical protein